MRAITADDHLDDALAELDRALGTPGVVGLTMGTTVAGKALTDREFAPLWQELDRRGAVVFPHPTGDCAGRRHPTSGALP